MTRLDLVHCLTVKWEVRQRKERCEKDRGARFEVTREGGEGGAQERGEGRKTQKERGQNP